MNFKHFTLQLPEWVNNIFPDQAEIYSNVEERMKCVINLSRLNVEYKTGGPFGAAIFDLKSKKLIAPGVNLVLPSNCSVAHAEIVAIMIGQQEIKHHTFSENSCMSFQLVSSTEPCAMCLGAVPWSGVQSIVCGARNEDARNIAFDEGHKPTKWVELFRSRGIEVIRDVCREEAVKVFALYRDLKGVIYNG